MKTEKELRAEFKEEIVKGVFKTEKRTLEKALEEALDLTTPEEPGDPRDKKEPALRSDDDEWL